MAEEVPIPSDGCIVGDLDTWALPNVIGWLHQGRRTAMVRVGQGLTAGVLFFREGHLTRCEFHGLDGEDALECLLEMNDGTLNIIQREIPDARPNVFKPTAEVLLGCTAPLHELRKAS